MLPALIASATVVVGMAPVLGLMPSIYASILVGFYGFGKLRERLLKLPERLLWEHGASRQAGEIARSLKRTSFRRSHHGLLDLVLQEVEVREGELEVWKLDELTPRLPGTSFHDQRMRLVRASSCLWQGDLEEALNQLVPVDPPMLEKIRWLRPLLRMSLGDHPGVLEEVGDQPEPDLDVWSGTWRELPRATALLALGRKEEALSGLHRISPEALLDPHLDEWLKMILTLLNAHQLSSEAEALRERMLVEDLSAAYRPNLDLLGGVLPSLARGDFTRARILAEAPLPAPREPGIDRVLMLLAAALGEGDQDAFEGYLSLARSQVPEAILPHALLAILPEALPESLASRLVKRLLDEVSCLELEPETLSVLKLQHARYQEDRAESQRILEGVSPEHLPEGFWPIWANNLSWYLHCQGRDLPRALELAEGALEAIPECSLFRLNLLCVHAHLGRDPERVVEEIQDLLAQQEVCPERWRPDVDRCLEMARKQQNRDRGK